MQGENTLKVLLIGNGGSILEHEAGNIIDTFDGKVVRFNNFQTEGFEKNAGTRTNIVINVWCGEKMTKEALMRDKPNLSLFVPGKKAINRMRRKMFRVHKEGIIQFTFSPEDTIELEKKIRFSPASTGALACQRFLDFGYEVTIHGFDYLNPKKKHHYFNNDRSLAEHKPDREKRYFTRLLKEGKIKCLKVPESITAMERKKAS